MLTWLVEKAPELVLHISLALLQVLLLEAREWEEVTHENFCPCLPRLPCAVSEEGSGQGWFPAPQIPGRGGQDSHVDKLRLTAH
jgi:hypothetical protein